MVGGAGLFVSTESISCGHSMRLHCRFRVRYDMGLRGSGQHGPEYGYLMDMAFSRRLLTFSAIAGLLTVCLGCGPRSHREVREQFDSQDTPRADVHIVEPSVGLPQDSSLPNLVNNGSFENRDESGRPLDWAVSPADILVPENFPAVYPFEGDDYVTLQSTADAFGIVAFPLALGEEDLGKTVVATAQGRAPLRRYMFLAIRYAVDGEYIDNIHEWPACPDTWTENIARETIPLDADPKSVQVRILIRDVAGYTFCVDHVRAFVLNDA